jgi:hypothetical protein
VSPSNEDLFIPHIQGFQHQIFLTGCRRYSKLRPTLLLLCLDSKLPVAVVEGGLDNGKKVTKVGFVLGLEGLASSYRPAVPASHCMFYP